MTPTTSHLAARRGGFALPVAILSMVVIGALVTGGFYAATQEGKVGASTRFMTQAQYVAEQGAVDVAANWTRPDYEQTPVQGTSAVYTDTIRVAGQAVGAYDVVVHRLSQRLYLIESTGRVIRNGDAIGASRRVGMIVRSRSMNIPTDRAIQLFGGLTVTGTSEVNGQDSYPGNWDDCTSLGEETGIVARDSTQVDTGGNGEISGDPPVAQDPSLDADDFLEYGDVDFDYLAGQAEKVYADDAVVSQTAAEVDADGDCDTAPRSNWGAPKDETHACHTYFPIIYGQGDLTLNASSNGQGILLVEGDLSLAGGFEFYGIIIVKGTLKTTGSGAHMYGMSMVYGDGVLDSSSLSAGKSIMNFSSCSIERALMYNATVARAVPIASRSWIDLSSAGAT